MPCGIEGEAVTSIARVRGKHSPWTPCENGWSRSSPMSSPESFQVGVEVEVAPLAPLLSKPDFGSESISPLELSWTSAARVAR